MDVRIAVAADHAGLAFKKRLVETLRSLGHDVTDFGTQSEKSCDYPDFAIPAAGSVSEGKNERAILVCNNGIGMSMVANKTPGVRAAMVYSAETAAMTRAHHDSNVLCLGGQQFGEKELLDFVRIWLGVEFDGGRHARRVAKLQALDEGK